MKEIDWQEFEYFIFKNYKNKEKMKEFFNGLKVTLPDDNFSFNTELVDEQNSIFLVTILAGGEILALPAKGVRGILNLLRPSK